MTAKDTEKIEVGDEVKTHGGIFQGFVTKVYEKDGKNWLTIAYAALSGTGMINRRADQVSLVAKQQKLEV